MYQLGKKPNHRRKIYLSSVLVLAVLIIAGVIASRQIFVANTKLTQAPAVTRHISIAQAPQKTITTTYFKIVIPNTWQTRTSKQTPVPQYAWQGTGPENSSRWVQVYVDDIPATLAVNRLLPVSSTDGRIVVENSVSDNCVNFTDANQVNQGASSVLAKWSNVTFYCDTGNYERNVVGTGSVGAVNSVTVSGSRGSHHYLFLYTDDSSEPDYTVFTDMLSSFQAL